jgi:phosphoribosylformylglycinamidine synthase subunit PurL
VSDETPIHIALGLTDESSPTSSTSSAASPTASSSSMYSVMWSEHCSYKSSRIHLKRLPTEGEGVLVGPGENAGVMDVGDGIAAAIRIESHNHPSYIEPYQGAATGAGGILRDIFTMGARPIALMDPLRFGPLSDARSRWVAEGVVSGISGYGNSVGRAHRGRRDGVRRPTGQPAGERAVPGDPPPRPPGARPGQRRRQPGRAARFVHRTRRHRRRQRAGQRRLRRGQRRQAPGVQVGDPFEEKRLIEACLALLDAGLVVGIQDLGGAGLTCAASETAANAGMGMDFDVSAVPRRETAWSPSR